jgi:putative AlgH/UPF0301 family transcriptional regulator
MSSYPALLEAGFSASRDDQSELRFYAGHASWRSGQLDEEIEAGAWRVLPGTAQAVFDADPASLWRRLIISGDELKVERRAAPPLAVASR